MSGALQRQLYGVGIYEEEIVLSDFTCGAEKRFVVTPDQLKDFFQSETVFRPFPGLLWMRIGGNREEYLVILPAAERTILYRQVVEKKVKEKKTKQDLVDYKLRLPRIAVQAEIDPGNRKVGSIRMWGFFDRVLQEGSVLYELPLPNLSKSSLCLGSTERANIGGDVMGAIERTIFDTPFNHHNHIVGCERIAFEAYMAKYKGACPRKSLRPIGIGRELLGGAR